MQSPQRVMHILFVGSSQNYKIHHYKNLEKQIWDHEDFVLHNADSKKVGKMLKNLDVSKASGIDQFSAKFLKYDALVIAVHLTNINMSIKLDALPLKYKSAKIRPLFKKGMKTEAKN